MWKRGLFPFAFGSEMTLPPPTLVEPQWVHPLRVLAHRSGGDKQVVLGQFGTYFSNTTYELDNTRQ